MKAILAADSIESVTGSDVATAAEEMRISGRRPSDDVIGESFQQVGQRWECSQMEDQLVERDATDWLMDDETLGRGLQGGREDHGEQKWGQEKQCARGAKCTRICCRAQSQMKGRLTNEKGKMKAEDERGRWKEKMKKAAA